MADNSGLRVRGLATIGTAIAGILTAGAVGGGDAVVVGLLVFFGLGLAWLGLEAVLAQRIRAADTDRGDESNSPVAGGVRHLGSQLEAGPEESIGLTPNRDTGAGSDVV